MHDHNQNGGTWLTFRTGLLAIGLRTLQNEEWGNWMNVLFSKLCLRENWFISSVLYFTEVIITPLWLMFIFLSAQWRWQFALGKKEGFNIVILVQIVYNKTQWHIFTLFRLTTLSSFVPHSFCLSFLSVCRHTGGKTFWYAGRYLQTKTRSAAITLVLTPQGPELLKISDLNLCETTVRNEKKK